MSKKYYGLTKEEIEEILGPKILGLSYKEAALKALDELARR